MDFIDTIARECAGHLMEMNASKVTRRVFQRVTYQGAGQSGITSYELQALRNATFNYLPADLQAQIRKGDRT